MSEINLRQIIEACSSKKLSEEFVKNARWPDGIMCPRCKESIVSEFRTTNKYQCNTCNLQFSVTSRSFIHKTNLPLKKWIIAMYLINSNQSITAMQLSRDLKVPYKTGWSIRKKLEDIQNLEPRINIKSWLLNGLKLSQNSTILFEE